MLHDTRPRHPVRTLWVSIAGLLIAACAAPPAADWPRPLRPTDGEQWLMQVAAKGVQIYECRGDATSGTWTFVAPEADLFDGTGRPIGRHVAGPAWEAHDGSRLVGEAIAHADAPATGAVPWLVVKTRDVGSAGTFSAVIRIRRINTAGGLAPRGGCGPGSLGATAHVPYTADYVLYTVRTATPSAGVLS